MPWRAWLPLVAFGLLLCVNIACLGRLGRAEKAIEQLTLRVVAVEQRAFAAIMPGVPGVLRGEYGRTPAPRR